MDWEEAAWVGADWTRRIGQRRIGKGGLAEAAWEEDEVAWEEADCEESMNWEFSKRL